MNKCYHIIWLNIGSLSIIKVTNNLPMSIILKINANKCNSNKVTIITELVDIYYATTIWFVVVWQSISMIRHHRKEL